MFNKLQCNDSQFTLFSALIFTLINSLFIARCWAIIHPGSLHTMLFALSIPLVLFSAWTIIFSLFALPWLRKPLLVLLLVGSAASNYFMFTYGAVIDRNMMLNIFDTNTQEVTALLTPQLFVWLGLTGVVPAALLCAIKIRKERWWSVLLLRGLMVISAIMVILLSASTLYKDYASLFRNNKEIVKMVTPPNYVTGFIQFAHKQIAGNTSQLIRQGEDATKGALIRSQSKKTVVILVLGEASRAQDYSLGGYTRETNPELSKRDVIWFNHATSCGTETAVSVPCMFSGMTRSQYDADLAHHREGLMDVLAHGGINVLWRENDGGCKGACTRIPHTDMTKWNLNDVCHDGICLDDAELYRLPNILDGIQHDTVIVLHLMGSHGPAYYERYPPKMRRFTPTCDTNQIQDCTREALINTYDNSILYTDDIVSRTIDMLKQHTDMNTALVYLSDHGESLGENGIYLHGTPWLIAPDQQTHIPLLFWLSDNYSQGFHINRQCLQQKGKNDEVSQDNLFSTLLGMMDIRTHVYQQGLDLLATCRQ
ncbi:phosphoethanolamine transferase EptA [Mangrovibacter phragmitis]|uniref:Phosphoethanolamine transferase EptA n=1 Tax=Mangrovibacter phragmitis TaxID=1691903 RepID=A0A1B7L6S0_9ENTR|nr:phosphoethanolamine transferase EptA [Mangrovibacter phragmitis]OAT78047.1 phosphoethanolamine transferase EptA [Mangrovibacter phragmitis]